MGAGPQEGAAELAGDGADRTDREWGALELLSAERGFVSEHAASNDIAHANIATPHRRMRLRRES